MKDIAEIKRIYRKKAIIIFIIAAISALLYFAFLMYTLQAEAIAKQNRNNNRFFSSTLSNLNSNVKEMTSLKENFHHNNEIMLNDLVQAYSGSNFRKLRALPVEEQADILQDASLSMTNCAWLLVVDKKGEILVSDIPENVGLNIIEDTGNDMSEDEFKKLCNGNKPYDVISNPYAEYTEYTGADLYLYCKAIPGTYETTGAKYILLAFTSQILDTMQASMEDLTSWVNDSTIGNNGTAFVISTDKDLITYGSINGVDMTGQKASDLGFSPEILQDRYQGMTKIAGTKCYISMRGFSSELYGENNVIVAAVPARNLNSIKVSVVVWNVFLFLVFLFLVIVYSSYIRGEIMRKGEPLKKRKICTFKGTKFYFSRVLARKIFPIVFATVFLLWGAVFYYQTLMKLSDCFAETVTIENDIMKSVEASTNLQKEFRDYYYMQYTSRGELLAVIVSLNGEQFFNIQEGAGTISQYGSYDGTGGRDLVKDDYGNPVYVLNNSKILQQLANDNGVGDIYLISDRGITLATSSNYWNYALSTDPNDEAYSFWNIPYGKADHVIVDDTTAQEGMVYKYIGVPMYYYTCRDENGKTKYVNYIDYQHQDLNTGNSKTITRHRGLVQLQVIVGEDEFVLDNSKPEYVLSNTHLSNGGFLTGFEYDDELEDYHVFYSQKDFLNDRYAKELGISDKAFSGIYNGFQIFGAEMYLNSFRAGEDYYISTSLPVDTLYQGSLSSSLYCALYAFIAMAIISVMMSIISDRGEEQLYREETDPFALFFNFSTESWKGKTSSEKFETVVHNSMILLGFIFLLAMLFDGDRFDSDSAVMYILSGHWDRGIHIFSISACIVIIIVSMILINIFGKISYTLAEAFGSKVVTMMHMLISLIKTLVVVLVLLYCLYLMGIDATSLLASAGIMSVVVGLGAQSLVGDLLAGIFIILEGSLRVGDYVMINGVRGKVMQIGLRITRYEDDNQNVRVICNNELKSFANMSMKYSVVYYNIPVPYNENYKRIKDILNAEFLKLYEDHRFLKSIPVCLGIENFSESSVDVRVKFMCEECERYTVQRFMHDEIMRIFMENDITIPFNQLDIHVEHEHVLRDEVITG